MGLYSQETRWLGHSSSREAVVGSSVGQHSGIISRFPKINITNMEDIGRFGSVLFECLELEVAVGNGDSVRQCLKIILLKFVKQN